MARDYGVSRQWVHELIRRFEAEGEVGLEPRCRRPRRSPHRTSVELEEEIVELRKALAEEGLDAGAHTIAFHLAEHHGVAPAVSTIWRILTLRGFVIPQPQKRPRSSFIRFEADQPNERWQADITHWALADGTDVEILNIIDDHSRLLVGSDARVTTKGADVVVSFHEAAAAHGFPASVLTDNAAVFTGAPRGGAGAPSRSSSTLWGSGFGTPRRTIPRPAAKSSGFTRPRSGGCESSPRRRTSPSSRSSWTGSATTTTPAVPTGGSVGERRPWSSTPGRRRAPLALG